MRDLQQSGRRSFLTHSILVASGALLSATRTTMAQQFPASGGSVAPRLLEDIAIANRILAQEGVLDAFGHVTARHSRNPNRFLMSTALAPALIKADDLIEYDLNGNAVNTKGRAEYYLPRP